MTVDRPLVSNILQKNIFVNAADDVETPTNEDHYVRYQSQCTVRAEGARFNVKGVKGLTNTAVSLEASMENDEVSSLIDASREFEVQVLSTPIAGAMSTPSYSWFHEWRYSSLQTPPLPPLKPYDTTIVVRDLWSLGVQPLLSGRSSTLLAGFPKILTAGDSSAELETWVHLFQTSATHHSVEKSVPEPHQHTPSDKAVHLCLGGQLRFSIAGSKGSEDLAGKLVHWLEWHLAYGATSATVYLTRLVFSSAFPGFFFEGDSSSVTAIHLR